MSEAISIGKEFGSAIPAKEKVNVVINNKRDFGWKIMNAFRYVLPYPKKITNYIGVKNALLTKNPNHHFYPFKLGVEASGRCNLKCPLCPRSSNAPRINGDMEYEPYTKLIDTLAPYLFQVRFHNLGEPTLNPRLAEMVAYAHKKSIYTNFHTNGHFLTEERIHALINAGLDEVNIALDGLTESVYGQYRIGGSAKRVKEGIVQFCAIKRERRSKFPRINIQFLVMSHNEHEIPDLQTFAALAGVDWVILKTVNIMHGSDNGNKSYLPSDPKYSRYSKEKETLKLSKKYRCTRVFSEFIVNWDGSVGLCAIDDPKSGHIKGNAFQDDIKEILFGEDFVTARRKSLGMEYNMCEFCINSQSSV